MPTSSENRLPTLEQREEEHAAGWHVIDNGKRLFSLEAMPRHRFKIVDINCSPEELTEALCSAKRDPRDSFFYENRKSGAIVKDADFIFGFCEGDVRLKDFRPIYIPWWHRLWIKYGFLTAGLLGFLAVLIGV
jgi:hypothetical protein